MSQIKSDLAKVLIVYKPYLGKSLLILVCFGVILASMNMMGITVEDVGVLLEKVGGLIKE